MTEQKGEVAIWQLIYTRRKIPLYQKKMTMKVLFMIRFALFGVAMWFFGNLYEGIVLAPNQIFDTVEKLMIWDKYFTLTNPIFYFVPITHVAVFITWGLAINGSLAQQSKKLIRKAALFLLLAEIVTVYIVVQLNLTLFFGDDFSEELVDKVIQWNILNSVRVGLVGTAMLLIFRGHNRLLSTPSEAHSPVE